MKRVISVARAFSAHPVRFQLATTGDSQYVAFYNDVGWLTVAQRALGVTPAWKFKSFPNEVVGWDSHCNIAMAVYGGHIHLCCNMHSSPMRYYCTEVPGDISTLEPARMLGCQEDRTTYPRFHTDQYGDLVLTYRHGIAGKGYTIANKLVCGEWERVGTIFGSDGFSCYYNENEGHFAYCWRAPGGPRFNTCVCYAYSQDFETWEGGVERSYAPLTMHNSDIVDAVPFHGGLLNGNVVPGWDDESNPVVTYHKFDADGNTQIYNSRLEGLEWVQYQMTNHDFRWDFDGAGTIQRKVRVHPLMGQYQGGWKVGKNMEIIGKDRRKKTRDWRLEHVRGPANNDLPVDNPLAPQMLYVVREE